MCLCLCLCVCSLYHLYLKLVSISRNDCDLRVSVTEQTAVVNVCAANKYHAVVDDHHCNERQKVNRYVSVSIYVSLLYRMSLSPSRLYVFSVAYTLRGYRSVQ